MFRNCNLLLSGGMLRKSAPLLMMKPTTPAMMLFKPTQPLQMLKPSQTLLRAPCTKEGRTVLGRRLNPEAVSHLGRGAKRQKVWQYRFVEEGGPYDRVWLALGGKMKRRRIGRPKHVKDLRYYWRPIDTGSQTTYMRRLRKYKRADKKAQPMTLHATMEEMGRFNNGPLAQFNHLQKRFKGNAPPDRQDFEFRVF